MSEDYRVVNLEEGMPFVDQAIRRLDFEIHSTKRLKINCLKIIHGYGSSGTGGKIRVAVRRRLNELKNKKTIKDFIIGEEFSIFNRETIVFLDRCKSLRNDHDLNRSNNGVTFVLL